MEKAFASTLALAASVELLNTLYKNRRKEDNKLAMEGVQLFGQPGSVNSGPAFSTDMFSSFRRKYLIVHCLASFSDFLQVSPRDMNSID